MEATILVADSGVVWAAVLWGRGGERGDGVSWRRQESDERARRHLHPSARLLGIINCVGGGMAAGNARRNGVVEYGTSRPRTLRNVSPPDRTPRADGVQSTNAGQPHDQIRVVSTRRACCNMRYAPLKDFL